MSRPSISRAVLSFGALLFGAACGVDSGAPTAIRSPGHASRDAAVPGTYQYQQILGGHGTLLRCQPRDAAYGSAVIGPRGGDLIIGPHRLIIPPGALTAPVEISGSVPAGREFRIDLQPHGLEFRRAAGLILDATSCADVPTIVYLIDGITPSDPIVAIYTNWWHTIAAPIWHFSGYEVAMRGGCQPKEDVMDGRATDLADGDGSSCAGAQ